MALAIALGCSHPDRVSAQRPFRIATFNMRTDCDKGEHAWVNRLPLVVKVIEDNYLKNHQEPEEIEYYLCGPPMMTAAVTKMLDDYGVPPEMIAFDDFGG